MPQLRGGFIGVINGYGSLSTGTLLETINCVNCYIDAQEAEHGGMGFSIDNSERMFLKILQVGIRFPGSDWAGGNEQWIYPVINFPGYTDTVTGALGTAPAYNYSSNAVNGATPCPWNQGLTWPTCSGSEITPTTMKVENVKAAFVVDGPINVHIYGPGSDKSGAPPNGDIVKLKWYGGSRGEYESFYGELSGMSPVFEVGGGVPYSQLQAAFSSTSLTAPVDAASYAWQHEQLQSCTDATTYAANASTYVWLGPPDFVAGDLTDNSILGNGIKKGTTEYALLIAFCGGAASPTLQVGARGQLGTTAVNWPAPQTVSGTTYYVQAGEYAPNFAPSLSLKQPHINGIDAPSTMTGYSYPLDFSTTETAADGECGYIPDGLAVPATPGGVPTAVLDLDFANMFYDATVGNTSQPGTGLIWAHTACQVNLHGMTGGTLAPFSTNNGSHCAGYSIGGLYYGNSNICAAQYPNQMEAQLQIVDTENGRILNSFTKIATQEIATFDQQTMNTVVGKDCLGECDLIDQHPYTVARPTATTCPDTTPGTYCVSSTGGTIPAGQNVALTLAYVVPTAYSPLGGYEGTYPNWTPPTSSSGWFGGARASAQGTNNCNITALAVTAPSTVQVTCTNSYSAGNLVTLSGMTLTNAGLSINSMTCQVTTTGDPFTCNLTNGTTSFTQVTTAETGKGTISSCPDWSAVVGNNSSGALVSMGGTSAGFPGYCTVAPGTNVDLDFSGTNGAPPGTITGTSYVTVQGSWSRYDRQTVFTIPAGTNTNSITVTTPLPDSNGYGTYWNCDAGPPGPYTYAISHNISIAMGTPCAITAINAAPTSLTESLTPMNAAYLVKPPAGITWNGTTGPNSGASDLMMWTYNIPAQTKTNFWGVNTTLGIFETDPGGAVVAGCSYTDVNGRVHHNPANPICTGGGGGGGVSIVVDNSGLFNVATPTTTPTFTYANQTANTFLSALSSGPPSWNPIPSCPTGAIGYVSGVGFNCNSSPTSGLSGYWPIYDASTYPGGTDPVLQVNNCLAAALLVKGFCDASKLNGAGETQTAASAAMATTAATWSGTTITITMPAANAQTYLAPAFLIGTVGFDAAYDGWYPINTIATAGGTTTITMTCPSLNGVACPVASPSSAVGTIGSGIEVGVMPGTTPAGLLLPFTGAWNFTLTDGVSVGIGQWGSTVISGHFPGGFINDGFIIQDASSATNMGSFGASLPGTGLQYNQYVTLLNPYSAQLNHGTINNGLINYMNMGDRSYIGGGADKIEGGVAVDGFKIGGNSCCFLVENWSSYGAPTTNSSIGGNSCHIGTTGTGSTATVGLTVNGLSCNHAALGFHDLLIQDVQSLTLIGLHSEGSSSQTASEWYLDTQANGVDFISPQCFPGNASTYCIEVHNANPVMWTNAYLGTGKWYDNVSLGKVLNYNVNSAVPNGSSNPMVSGPGNVYYPEQFTVNGTPGMDSFTGIQATPVAYAASTQYGLGQVVTGAGPSACSIASGSKTSAGVVNLIPTTSCALAENTWGTLSGFTSTAAALNGLLVQVSGESLTTTNLNIYVNTNAAYSIGSGTFTPNGDFIVVGPNSSTVTPGTTSASLTTYWPVEAGSSAPRNVDVAFYWLLGQAYPSLGNETLILGNTPEATPYITQLGLREPVVPVGNPGRLNNQVNIIGQGMSLDGSPTALKAPSNGSNIYAISSPGKISRLNSNLVIKGIGAYGSSSSSTAGAGLCFDIEGEAFTDYEWNGCQHWALLDTRAPVQIGGVGNGYVSFFHQHDITIAGPGEQTEATLSVALSGGSPVVTVSASGNYLNIPTAAKVYVWGTQNGTSTQPCSTMGTPVVTGVTGSFGSYAIPTGTSSINLSSYTGCTGTVNVKVVDLPANIDGENIQDSADGNFETTSVQTVGLACGISVGGSNNHMDHMHPQTYQFTQLCDVGSHDDYVAFEPDTPAAFMASANNNQTMFVDTLATQQGGNSYPPGIVEFNLPNGGILTNGNCASFGGNPFFVAMGATSTIPHGGNFMGQGISVSNMTECDSTQFVENDSMTSAQIASILSFNPVDIPLVTTLGSSAPAAVAGVGSGATGSTASCNTVCLTDKGEVTITTGASLTVHTIAGVTFAANLATVPKCSLTQNNPGGQAVFSIGLSYKSLNSGFNIIVDSAAGVAIPSTTILIDYSCGR